MSTENAVKSFFKNALIIGSLLLFSIHAKGQVNINTAVDFNVKDVESESHHLFNYLDENKIVVLDFFTATCGPCQTYATQISDAYDYFGCNTGNVIFLGINWGSDNDEVRLFDSLWDARYPGVSGIQGGGNAVVENYQVLSYPTVCVITPDHLIYQNYIWPPEYDSIVQVVLLAGGLPNQCTVRSNEFDLPDKPGIMQLSPGILNITLPEMTTSDLSLKIYSIDGKLVLNQTIQRQGLYDYASSLNRGIYIASLFEDDQPVANCKLIIP